MIKYLFLFCCIFFTNSIQSQEQYKISYSGKLMSSSMDNRLQKEVTDPFLLEAYKELIAGFEVIYGLYIDVPSGQSIFVEEKEYGLEGPPPFKQLLSYYKTGGNIYFEDLFRGKKFKVKDHVNNLDWVLGKETMSISRFSCKKAVLKDDPFNTIVWYSEDYPLPYGPYIGNGLPGLVVLLENDYYTISVKTIKKEKIPAKLQKQMQAISNRQGITIESYHKEALPILKTMSQETIIN